MISPIKYPQTLGIKPQKSPLKNQLPGLVKLQKTMEKIHFEWENSLSMAIFNSKLLVITRG
jgi:hypothetical protein